MLYLGNKHFVGANILYQLYLSAKILYLESTIYWLQANYAVHPVTLFHNIVS